MRRIMTKIVLRMSLRALAAAFDRYSLHVEEAAAERKRDSWAEEERKQAANEEEERKQVVMRRVLARMVLRTTAQALHRWVEFVEEAAVERAEEERKQAVMRRDTGPDGAANYREGSSPVGEIRGGGGR